MRTLPAIAMFGSSLVSAYWNGAATYYRGIIRNLHARGFRVTFFEPDAYERQRHRDLDDPDWARVVVYEASAAGVAEALEAASSADILIKASGVGVFDELLEAQIPLLGAALGKPTVFWDVDAPATLQRMRQDEADPFRSQVARYDLILTYGGGPPVVAEYLKRGARACVPIYNALDPLTHFPVAPEQRFAGDLAFLGNRLPDREARVAAFFLAPAQALPQLRFVLGGSGWNENIALPPNVSYVGHVYTRDHNAFNCSPRAVININRDSMAATGYSPPTRVFEAAGAGACLICDAWRGIEHFLDPGSEVIAVESGAAVASVLPGLTADLAKQIGQAARRRILAQHTYAHRAAQVHRLLAGDTESAASPSRPVEVGPRAALK
jgi:spore maturation protein CgeB